MEAHEDETPMPASEEPVVPKESSELPPVDLEADIRRSQHRIGLLWKAFNLLLFVQMCWISAMTVIPKLTTLLDLIVPSSYVRPRLLCAWKIVLQGGGNVRLLCMLSTGARVC
jgi:hypothetical protein